MKLWAAVVLLFAIFIVKRNEKMYTAVVWGSTGAVGRAVVASAAKRGFQVIAVVRPRNSKLEETELFPDLDENFKKNVRVWPLEDEKWLEKGASWPNDVARVDAVFLCLGTSRANEEVKSAMEAEGDKGFENWLERVDVNMSKNIVNESLSRENPARVVLRVSSSGANPKAEGGGFNVYFRGQGRADDEVSKAALESNAKCHLQLWRPGRLDRGQDLRAKREWEVRQHDASGPGLCVKQLAQAMVLSASESCEKQVTGIQILTPDDISARISML